MIGAMPEVDVEVSGAGLGGCEQIVNAKERT
jgi:hypothetical protein